jgi:hypothetical protein
MLAPIAVAELLFSILCSGMEVEERPDVGREADDNLNATSAATQARSASLARAARAERARATIGREARTAQSAIAASPAPALGATTSSAGIALQGASVGQTAPQAALSGRTGLQTDLQARMSPWAHGVVRRRRRVGVVRPPLPHRWRTGVRLVRRSQAARGRLPPREAGRVRPCRPADWRRSPACCRGQPGSRHWAARASGWRRHRR